MRRVTRSLAVIALTSIVGACGIAADDSPRDVVAGNREVLEPGVEGGAATGTARIFLLTAEDTDQARRLRSVLRDVPESAGSVLDALLSGPNTDELDQRLGTAIPSTTALLSARAVGGVLTVDVSDPITELSGDGLTNAVAQIVFTASELEGVRGVRIRVDGEPQSWPRADGAVVATPLTIYDYPGFAESTQPAFPALPSPTPA